MAPIETVKRPDVIISRLQRTALACGLVFVVLLVLAGVMGPESPGSTVSPGQLADWYRTYRTVSLAQTYVRGLAAFSMLIFVAGLTSLMDDAENGTAFVGTIATGAAAIFAAVMFASNMVNASATYLASLQRDPEIVAALDGVGDMMRHLNGLAAAVTVSAATLGLRRARAVPVWAAWLGTVGALLFAIGGIGFLGTRLEVLNQIAFPVLIVWPVVYSIVLLRPRHVRPS